MRFAFELLGSDGRVELGTLDAPSEGDARRQLQRKGGTLLTLAEQDESRRRGTVSQATLLLAFAELTTLLRSGLGIAESVSSIATAHAGDSLHEPLEKLGRAIAQGRSFSDALRDSGLALPGYFLQFAAAGEMTGKLAESLEEAVAQYTYQQQVASDIRGALIYPAVLVASGIIAVGIMFTYVVPKFTPLLERAQSLPLLARVVLGTGTFLSSNALLVLVLLTAFIAAVVHAWRTPALRAQAMERIARLPLIGVWLAEAETGRWAAMLGALLAQGVPVLDALALANRDVALASRRHRFDAAARAVRNGLALSRALEEQGALPPTGYNLLRTGEQAGRLPQMLAALARLYGNTARERMKRVLLLIEPLAILMIGGTIGLIVTGIILAIVSTYDIPI
jgi:general secretion pathway protein F